MKKKVINIIGAGNVAHHFAPRLAKRYDIATVFSKSITHASKLARTVNSMGVDNFESLNQHVDLNFIFLKDDIIQKVLPHLPKNIPVIISSGSYGLELLDEFLVSGVLYPFQTISKEVDLNFNEITFLLESNNNNLLEELIDIVSDNFGASFLIVNSEIRKVIHLAAVISSNFTNRLIVESQEILKNVSVDYRILEPLMKETLRKAFLGNPEESQTGPAKRGDVLVVKKQLDFLSDIELKELYRILSKRINPSLEIG